ncbi:hypothetical protein NMG60_11000726 [Bertholletia excelsa]
MALYLKFLVLTSNIILLVLLHEQYFVFVRASRPMGIHPPANPTASFGRSKLLSVGRSILNRYKPTEATGVAYYRPTTPGNSPAVGHDGPPAAKACSFPPA